MWGSALRGGRRWKKLWNQIKRFNSIEHTCFKIGDQLPIALARWHQKIRIRRYEKSHQPKPRTGLLKACCCKEYRASEPKPSSHAQYLSMSPMPRSWAVCISDSRVSASQDGWILVSSVPRLIISSNCSEVNSTTVLVLSMVASWTKGTKNIGKIQEWNSKRVPGKMIKTWDMTSRSASPTRLRTRGRLTALKRTRTRKITKGTDII